MIDRNAIEAGGQISILFGSIQNIEYNVISSNSIVNIDSAVSQNFNDNSVGGASYITPNDGVYACNFRNNSYTVPRLVSNIDFSKGYYLYKAILSQTGASAPTATVLTNEVGGITYSYVSSGVYGYAFSLITPSVNTNAMIGSIDPALGFGIARVAPPSVLKRIYSNIISTGVATDGLISGTPFEIQVPLA